METIRIQDDLYTYVNQETLDRLVIPEDKPYAGGFAELAEGVEKIMMGEFEAMAESKDYPNDHMKRACEPLGSITVCGTITAEQTAQWEPSVLPGAVQVASTPGSTTGVWPLAGMISCAVKTSPQVTQ